MVEADIRLLKYFHYNQAMKGVSSWAKKDNLERKKFLTLAKNFFFFIAAIIYCYGSCLLDFRAS